MANNTKYRKNRNNWRKVYGLRRRKPVLSTYTDTVSGVSVTIDHNKVVRDRGYFEDDKAIPAND